LYSKNICNFHVTEVAQREKRRGERVFKEIKIENLAKLAKPLSL
jgi:hypothetical protein